MSGRVEEVLSMSEFNTLRLLEDIDEALDLDSPPIDNYEKSRLTGKLAEWTEGDDLLKLSIDEGSLILESVDLATSQLQEIWVAARTDPLVVKNVKNKRTLIEDYGFELFKTDEQTSLNLATILECEATEDRPFPRAWLSDGRVYFITEDIKGRFRPLDKVQVVCHEDGTCAIKRGLV
jgi:hypothetical protein